MKLTFEPNLNFQLSAIESITNIFKGQPLENSLFEFPIKEEGTFDFIHGHSNNLFISQDQILTNLQSIQELNEIQPQSEELDGMNFSVEMETGTGKTYVYLRSIYELNKLYNFKKFVIVVPSIAIREGVLKNLEITHEHFQKLYNNISLNFQVYDSSKISSLRNFATNNTIEILVINIDSFAKDLNIINKPHYRTSGRKPIEFIQATNPIVILDEPQNMETEKRKNAINNLNPLCTLRYSATHRNPYNLVYSLDPVKAYDLGLVKQIEVDSIIEENADNEAFISLFDLNATKTKVSAKISILVNDAEGVKKKTLTANIEDDLFILSNERESYKNNFIIDEIDVSNEYISFLNGIILYKGQSQGGLTDEVMKIQIEKTIVEHLNKERLLNPKGVKVLSLIFIDKVSNYRQYDNSGNPLKGKFAEWFEEIYLKYISRPAYNRLNKHAIDETHNGYFAADSKGNWKDTKETQNSRDSKAAGEAFNLIMKDKEELLNIQNPLRFIFSHSALREGWDNPNVFQICTLNETKSSLKKRQEIGRGLRLAVDQTGNRIYEKNINRLTIVANEAYEDFAKTLQKEIENDCGVKFSGRIKNRKERKKVVYRKGFEADPLFLEIWDSIKSKTFYSVNYDSDKLIKSASKAIMELPPIKAPTIRSTKIKIDISEKGVDTIYTGDKVEKIEGYIWKIPDVLSYIQSKTELTRSTINEILVKSGRIEDILINPQLFLDMASHTINLSLYEQMIDGIKYTKKDGAEYEMSLFEAQDLEVYINDYSFNVSERTKTIYDDFIPLDSGVESQFAEDCESSEQVKFYFKLPSWFKIPTPIGTYNPDWAIVFENEEEIYFVAETKNTGKDRVELEKLTLEQQQKIKCGKAHFKEFENVEYKVISKVGQLV